MDRQLSFLSAEGIRLALERNGYLDSQITWAAFTGRVNSDGDHVYDIEYPYPDAPGGSGIGTGSVYVSWGTTGPVAEF
jgi:hypothetical protein